MSLRKRKGYLGDDRSSKKEDDWVTSKNKMEEDTSEGRALPIRGPSTSIEEAITEGGITPHPIILTTGTVLINCSGGKVRIGMVPFCCNEGTLFIWRDYTPGRCVFCNDRYFELRWMGLHGDKGKEPIMQDSLVRSEAMELPGKYKVTVCKPCFEKYGTHYWIGRNDLHHEVYTCSMSNVGVQCCLSGITCRLRPIAMLAFNYENLKWNKEDLLMRCKRE